MVIYLKGVVKHHIASFVLRLSHANTHARINVHLPHSANQPPMQHSHMRIAEDGPGTGENDPLETWWVSGRHDRGGESKGGAIPRACERECGGEGEGEGEEE